MTDPTAQDPEPGTNASRGDQPTRTDAGVGRASDSLSVHRPLEEIGPYRLLQRIGAGGMGEVWLAEQTEPVRRRVALKLIKAGMDTEQVVARFEAERQALAMMDHSSIAKVFDAGETPQGRPYFVMEHIQGVPITEHCDRQRLTIRERLELFVPVCEGVQHAHQKAIIHRDLKPSNVLVTVQDGKAVPKIIDFGVAKATSQRLTERTMFTEFGVLIGTPEYMSPEQAEMTALDVDTRTDVYSLGVILYELVVGALPFDSRALRSAGFAGIVRIIREEEPPRPSTRLSGLGDRSADSAECRRVDSRTLRRQLRGDLDWITMKAIEKERARRYGSPAEFAADVVRHLKDEPVSAGPPSKAYRAGKFVKRHRVGVFAAAASVLVLAGFAVTMAVQARRIATEREASDRVSAFLASMLGDVNPRDMGAALWRDLHRQVAEASRGRGALQDEVDAALESLDEAFAGVNATDAALRLLDEQVLARAAQTIERDLDREPRIAGRLEHTLGDTYRKLGLYGPAERHAKRAVELRKRTLGMSHPYTLDSMNDLGLVYDNQGRYAEAETLLEEALEVRRRRSGQEDPGTLATMNNLANVYRHQDRYAEAADLHQRVLETKRRVLGQDHPDTLASMNNLAVVYHFQGRYAETEKLHEETLEIQRRVLGPDHPNTVRSMSNLAGVYNDQRRYAEAESLHRQALEIRRRVLGQDHPDTLASMTTLAMVHYRQGRYAEAERLHEDALEIKRRVLGQDHPDTLWSMSNLANVYVGQERYAEAERLYKETLEVQRRVLGRDHRDTLISRENLANVYASQGRYAEAEQLVQETLEIERRTLGEDHPDTLGSMYNLACVAVARGNREQALERVTRAIECGFKDADWLAQDEAMRSLLGDAAFERLLARARENASKSK